MRAPGLISIVVLSGCAGVTTTQQVNRSVLGPLAPVSAPTVMPDDWVTVYAASQLAPFESRGGGTAVQVPAAQPELGLNFRTAYGHLVAGASLHAASADWGRAANEGQPRIQGGLLFGARARIGVSLGENDKPFGLLVALEPGFDALPWSNTISPRSTESRIALGLSGSAAGYFQNAHVRVYVGLAGATLPQTPLTVTVPTGCAACATPDLDYAGYFGGLAGVRVRVSESIALAASLTVPFTQNAPQMMPMLTLAVMAQSAPEKPPEPEEPPLSPPPLPPLPLFESPAL